MIRKPGSCRPTRHQRGFAMIAMITLVTMVSAYLLSTALSRTTAEVRLESDTRSRDAMKEAKAALIAYAASQAWQVTGANDQPGALPCPATNENGSDPGSCTTESTRVGFLPWRTIGSSELRDGSGNLLWYALSANFRKLAGTTIINSDTVGTLTITGNAPATQVVAVIIAPGSALNGQNRTSTAVANYLEGSNANTSDSDTFTTAQSSDTFNDQIMIVTQADLMAVVEPAVASRIETSIKPYITSYASQWSAYPYPAAFPQNSAAQSSYSGDTTLTTGMLPVTASLTYPWTASSGAVTLTGGTAGSITGVTCVAGTVGWVVGTGWRCDFTIRSRDSGASSAGWAPCSARYCMDYPAFTVTGRISSNAALSFVKLPDATTGVTVTSTGGAARAVTGQAISGAFSGANLATVSFQATHVYTRSSSASFTRVLRVFIPDATVSPISSDTDADAGWFIKQQWYRQTYYAFSSGFKPVGGSACTAGSTCLTVNGLPSSYLTSNDKRAILVFAGRKLVSTMTRPSSTLSDYLEGQNATPADNIFQHFSTTTSSSGGASTSVNDRVIVLAP
jgi:hypothetical protein